MTLFDPGPADVHTLTERLETAHRALVQAGSDGILAVDLGAHVHHARGAHRNGADYCQHCAHEGRSCLHSLAQRGLARRDRRGMWRAATVPDSTPSKQGDLPQGF